MIVNIIGDCDKRPVLYTVMKIFQTLGDVLLVSSSSRLLRLSESKENGGHYQNTMVCITQEGIDDFINSFGYSMDDFDHIIVDNMVVAEADLVIYVEGLVSSESEQDLLEYIEEYSTIHLYKNKLVGGDTIYKLEQFEALRNMCTINKALSLEVAKVLSPVLNISVDSLSKMAMSNNPNLKATKPEKKGPQKKLLGGML